MNFTGNFYSFQKDILDKFDNEVEKGDKKIHIVAPPGSGKTIVGIEISCRVGGNILILVPNITLQLQRKDKIKSFFLEPHENIDDLVSLSPEKIARFNIITYQSLTQSSEGDDEIYQQTLRSWFNDLKEEFDGFDSFTLYIESLKDFNAQEYEENISKYRKKQKVSSNVDKLLTDKIKQYFSLLKEANVTALVLDEAHHLTSWWSTVAFHLREYLQHPYVIGLTATPPFNDPDFFILDPSYANLLGEVDYYVPTPAVVKSGKLAPYQDLVYLVEPGDSIASTLATYQENLDAFLVAHKDDICLMLRQYISKDFDNLIDKKGELLTKYLRFLYHFSDVPISDWLFASEITENVMIEDIAKSIGKRLTLKRVKEIGFVSKDIQSIMYDLGYLWRGSNFYKFSTPSDKMLVYSKSKIDGVCAIINAELATGNVLQCAIITDFFDENDANYINCQYLLSSIAQHYKNLNVVLVSGQGNFLYQKFSTKPLEDDILQITKQFEEGKYHIIIGTRGILGEGRDCPKLNTLIDLTGVQSFMSTNQVRGRAIRLDYVNPTKVANIYDIVCLGQGYKGDTDLVRLKNKHDKFYGIDGSGLIIKGIDHIYPDLVSNVVEGQVDQINENMILRVEKRDYIYQLWSIDKGFSNKEIFGLNLHISSYGQEFPLMKLGIITRFKFLQFLSKQSVIQDIAQGGFYVNFIIKFLNKFIDAICRTLKSNGILPKNFDYKIIKSGQHDIKIVSYYHDDLVIKSFMSYLSNIFCVITDHKYALKLPFAIYDGKDFMASHIYRGLSDELVKNSDFRTNFIDSLFETFGVKRIRRRKQTSNEGLNTIQNRLGSILYVILIVNFSPTFSEDNAIVLLWVFLFGGFIRLLICNYIWTLLSGLYLKGFFGKSNKILYSYSSIADSLLKKYISDDDVEIIYLNGSLKYKSNIIGKKPFITGKIEKIWI